MTKSIPTKIIPNNKISFPFSPNLQILFNHLLKNGDELRVVGGSVRDFLSGKKIDNTTDIDLACKYSPEQTSLVLKQNQIKVIASGIKYGTVTAIIDDEQFQITTLRKDIKNFGRDCEVEFDADFFEDAKRRDFTINAMSVDFNGNLYDYFGGVHDLENQIVRFIGDAKIRITEDYLRILRFFRFSCYFDQSTDKSGLEACIKYKNHLNDLSKERVKEELFKMFRCENRANLLAVLQMMFDAQILNIIFNSIDQKKIDAIKNLFALEKILNQKFSTIIFLAVISNGQNLNLRLSNAEKKYLQIIFQKEFLIDFKISKKNLLKLLLDFNKQELIDIYIVALALNNNFENLIDDFLEINKMIMQVVSSSQITAFPINGYDLIALEIESKNIGKFLKIARNYWWEKDFAVNKNEILSYLKIINDSA